MLQRFDERAPVYDRENRFFSEDFEELRRVRLPVGAAARRDGRLRARPGRGQPAAAPPRLPRPGHRGGREHAPLLGRDGRRPAPDGRPDRRLDPRAGRRRRRARRRSRRGRQRPAGAAVQLAGRARRRRLGVHRPQDLRQPVAGVDVPRRPRHGHQRPRAARRSCTPSCTATRRATGSRRRGTRSACGPPRPTTRSSTARSSPTARSSLVCPAGFAGAGPFHVALFAWALLGFAGVYAGIAQRAYDETVEPGPPAHLGRADPLDGLPPRRAAPDRRDAHRPGGPARLTSTARATTGRPGVDHGDGVAARRSSPASTPS